MPTKHSQLSLILLVGLLCLAAGFTLPVSERYWPTASTATTVLINGFGYGFAAPHEGCGVIDGPFCHDGRYAVVCNNPGQLQLRFQFGTDAARADEMDLSLTVEMGRVTLRGVVDGEAIVPREQPLRRTGKHYVVRFRARSGKVYRIRWMDPAQRGET